MNKLLETVIHDSSIIDCIIIEDYENDIKEITIHFKDGHCQTYRFREGIESEYGL